jgi:hypothetical protein
MVATDLKADETDNPDKKQPHSLHPFPIRCLSPSSSSHVSLQQ